MDYLIYFFVLFHFCKFIFYWQIVAILGVVCDIYKSSYYIS
jgi:hypothetical protein